MRDRTGVKTVNELFYSARTAAEAGQQLPQIGHPQRFSLLMHPNQLVAALHKCQGWLDK